MSQNNPNPPELVETSALRRYSGLAGKLVFLLAILIPLISTFEVLKIGNYFGFFPKAGAVLSLFLGFIMALIFLTVPARKTSPGKRVPWYDACAALFCIIGSIYLALVYADFEFTKGVGYTPFQLFLGVVAIVLLLETTRRTVGWPMIILTIAFVLYAGFGNYVPGILTTRGYDFDRIIGVLFVPREGMFGIATELAAGLLIVFIFFGQLLTVTGMGEWFTGIANSLVGHVRGGPAKISVIASLLLGMVQGSAAANVATTGVMTIPLMKKTGYSSHFAAAVESVASVGGQITPPVMGMTAFLMAEFLDIPYASVALAAVIPAFLYYLAVFIQVDLEAVQTGLKGLPKTELPPLKKTFVGGIHYLLPIFVLLYLLIIKGYSPQTSAYYASAGLILVSIIFSIKSKEKRISIGKIGKALEETSYGMFIVATSCAASGLIISIVNLTAMGANLSMFLVDISGGSLFLLLVLTA
ncbi:MAG: TRAP transporter fused permease subunit, partial [Dehalococcoidia bacterium]|nr:TRAP transporter fused permease subunit [Dehalococcoidia bacterium]